MKTEKNILVAFLLNLLFSLFEIAGGMFIGSVAIVSDAIHDFGDSVSIGISYFLEKKSKKSADETYTYGYGRFSVLGAFITNVILVVGSISVILMAIERLFNPKEINYPYMIVFAVLGIVINGVAALKTSGEGSLNQKAVNLHMLEDVLGWAVVLLGSVIMLFTDLKFIDSVMSIGVAIFVLYNVFCHIKEIGELFLVKLPDEIDMAELNEKLGKVEGLISFHHLHIWRIDEGLTCATLHAITSGENEHLKGDIRHVLSHFGINHATIELEREGEDCHDLICKREEHHHSHSHHHHH